MRVRKAVICALLCAFALTAFGCADRGAAVDPAVFTAASEGVYRIDALTLTDGFYGSSAFDGRYAAVATSGMFGEDTAVTTRITVFDLAKNTVKTNIDLGSGVYRVSFLPDGSLYAGSSAQGLVLVYNINGRQLYRYEGINGGGDTRADAQGRLWAFDYATLHCLVGGKDISYEIPSEAAYFTVIHIEGDRVFYSYAGGLRHVDCLNTADSSVNGCPALDGYSGNGKLMTKLGDGKLKFSSDGEKISTAVWDKADYNSFCAFDSQYAFLSRGSGITRLDTQSGQTREFEIGGSIAGIAPCGGAAFVTATEGATQYAYYLADTAADGQLTITVSEPSEIERANIELAARLSKLCDIRISSVAIPAEQVVGAGYYTYKGPTDAQTCSEFLKSMENCLTEYPDGFFTEIKAKGLSEIEFMFGTALNGSSGQSLGAASAITFFDKRSVTIMLDASRITSDIALQRVLSHELMHTIQFALRLKDNAVDPFAGYAELNPKGFAYADRYVKLEGTSAGDNSYIIAPGRTTDFENVWFVSKYSKTYLIEDSAEVFEAMTTLSAPYLFKSPHVMAKAEYTSQLLRAQFPAWYENGEPRWERFRDIEQ